MYHYLIFYETTLCLAASHESVDGSALRVGFNFNEFKSLNFIFILVEKGKQCEVEASSLFARRSLNEPPIFKKRLGNGFRENKLKVEKKVISNSQISSRKEEGKAAERKIGSVIAEVSKMIETLFSRDSLLSLKAENNKE